VEKLDLSCQDCPFRGLVLVLWAASI